MIAALIAVVMALALILVKITITALLAVLYVLSPLAIGLWPGRAAVVAVADAAAGRVRRADLPRPVGGMLRRVRRAHARLQQPGAPQPLFGVAALIIAFKLPFALLRISTGAGLIPSAGKGMSAIYHARGLVRA